LQKILLW